MGLRQGTDSLFAEPLYFAEYTAEYEGAKIRLVLLLHREMKQKELFFVFKSPSSQATHLPH